MAAMAAAITPSKMVPCRVVNSLLDMMLSTCFSSSDLSRKSWSAVSECLVIAKRWKRDSVRIGVLHPEAPNLSRGHVVAVGVAGRGNECPVGAVVHMLCIHRDSWRRRRISRAGWVRVSIPVSVSLVRGPAGDVEHG